MHFTKMHGIGNDFIFINAINGETAEIVEKAKKQCVALCDRKFGIGADGLVLVMPSDKADYRMRIFNADDASEPEMCGNAIRCFAKYLYDNGLTTKTQLDVETGAGVLTTRAHVADGRVDTVEVDMGEARLLRSQIPATLPGDDKKPIVLEQIDCAGRQWNVTCVSMGNPHCVVFVDDVASFPVAELGPHFENHHLFPRRTNTEFVQVVSPTELRMRVWERGVGETLACGTGACASAVAASLAGKSQRCVVVHLLGGDLKIDWAKNNHVFMTGSASIVFEGETPLR